ncbi:MAG: polyribonucleotide nucleotidyltransferase [Puniceicoccales bacterium]|jgi:polyribonucleotide nucleotidyltransferase|nr:polyribonucleotide nucleotidyltransferase [Puniceicoccales bacterium]
MKDQSIASIQTHREFVESLDMTFSTGALAKQANGSVVVQMGETVVFVSVTADDNVASEQDFLPLSVEYREKFCAAGRFPGGYIKREGRLSEKEILTSRLCDRSLRPLFPEGFHNGVQVISLLLSADLQNESDVLVVNGASAALLCSDIPWNGPIGCVHIGEVDGEFIANPTNELLYLSTLDLLYVGNEHDTMMIEGSADQISEERFLEALAFAHRQIQPIIAAQKRLAASFGREKKVFPTHLPSEDLIAAMESDFGDQLRQALLTEEKKERAVALNELLAAIKQKMMPQTGGEWDEKEISFAFGEWQMRAYRSLILNGRRRSDGRTADALRSITCVAGFLPRVHGVSLFQRGETQALVTATLGASRDVQTLDGVTGGVNEKSFIFHYNFPPFSVGETGKFGAVGRRELGHGALAERSILPVIPAGDVFPYSIRLVSEILESNGSSSMASVCGGTLALMDAGVPILAPVAGISVGLIADQDENGKIGDYVLLSDIIGLEDHFGDMDFKIAGTKDGITGFQLDLKITGLPFNIIREAIARNGENRREIAKIMDNTLSVPRSELRPNAPRTKVIRIPSEKIGSLVGPSGKNIRRITEMTGAQIDIHGDNSGDVTVFAPSGESLNVAIREIEMQCSEIEVGKTYHGIIRTVKEFGVFVECLPGKEALVHISELSEERIEDLSNVCKIGDEIIVKCVGVDGKGRVRLSRKAAICESKGIPYAAAPMPSIRPRRDVRSAHSCRIQ